jgi:hypothetical protein
MTELFPVCSRFVPGLFPVAGVENSGHRGLFSVFPSVVMTDAHAQELRPAYSHLRREHGNTENRGLNQQLATGTEWERNRERRWTATAD